MKAWARDAKCFRSVEVFSSSSCGQRGEVAIGAGSIVSYPTHVCQCRVLITDRRHQQRKNKRQSAAIYDDDRHSHLATSTPRYFFCF